MHMQEPNINYVKEKMVFEHPRILASQVYLSLPKSRQGKTSQKVSIELKKKKTLTVTNV